MFEKVRQKATERVLYPLLVRYHRSRELLILRELQASERFSEDQLYHLRLARLRALVEHASKYVPFYQTRFAEAGFNPQSVKDLSDLKKLPLLSKSDIQCNRERLISTFYRREKLVENRTGGSTGSPLVFYHHRERLASRQAATLRHNLWAGYRVGCKTALIWGHQADLAPLVSLKARLRNIIIDRQIICDSASFSAETLNAFIGRFKSFKPEVILAYANSLGTLVDFCMENGIELPSPKTIITSAEVLSEENRLKIENFFKARVFDRYGSRETSVIASECEAHDGMHINAENLYLEFLDGNRDVAPGGTGEIVVTDLGNFAFPFIRYQIGDMGAPAMSGCSCGRTLPKMQMVAGRTTDFLVAPDGRRVSGAALTIYLAAKVPGIRQAQIVQRELSRLIFNLVVNESFNDASRELIRQKVDHFFGAEMAIATNLVESIPKEASGKYRFSICELEPAGQRL